MRPVESNALDHRWHRIVYDESQDRVIRNGQVSGDRDKAERASRAAIALMSG